MEYLTFGIAFAGVLVVLSTRPVYGLMAYLAVVLLYPDYLRISIGTIDVSAARIVVTVLLGRCIGNTQLARTFRWNLLDVLVLASMFVYAATLLFTTPFQQWLENRSGFIMDTLFPYLAVRLVIVDRASFVVVVKAVAAMSALLSLHAVAETLGGWSLFMGLGKYCPWAPGKGMAFQMRYGLNRAMGPPGETIMFGLAFAVVLPLIWLLRHEPRPWKWLAGLLTAAAAVGVVATLSSGPWVALVVVLCALALERAKYLVKPLIAVLLIGCLTVEVLSNRHFYYALTDFTMDPGSAWYRARLIDVAILKLPEYWRCGYGYVEPGWGPDIDGRATTDGVNEYVVSAIVHGIPGLVAFASVLFGGMWVAVRAHATARRPWLRSCAWALASALSGLMIAIWSVSIFAQMVCVFYILLGMHGALRASLGYGENKGRSPEGK